MATGIVQFRVANETLAYLEEKGINPNQLAREAFEAKVRRLRAEESMDELANTRIEFPRSAADMIREDRDSR